MDDNRFWATVVACVAGVVIVLITAFSMGQAHKRTIAAQMVEQGVGPLAVYCLIYADKREPVCIVLAAKGGSH